MLRLKSGAGNSNSVSKRLRVVSSNPAAFIAPGVFVYSVDQDHLF